MLGRRDDRTRAARPTRGTPAGVPPAAKRPPQVVKPTALRGCQATPRQPEVPTRSQAHVLRKPSKPPVRVPSDSSWVSVTDMPCALLMGHQPRPRVGTEEGPGSAHRSLEPREVSWTRRVSSVDGRRLREAASHEHGRSGQRWLFPHVGQEQNAAKATFLASLPAPFLLSTAQ